MSAPRDTDWAQQLLKAERENRCGDLACQTRRTHAAVQALTGWKEHADIAWAVEVFEAEIGIRDPELVGREPDNIPSRGAIGRLTRRDLAETFCYLREHDHDGEPSCAASREEADQIVSLIALRAPATADTEEATR